MTAPFKTRTFLGTRFDLASLAQTLDWIATAVSRDVFSYVVTPNVDHIVRLHDPDLPTEVARAYRAASLVVCDSRIVGALARLTGKPLTIVPGSDLTHAILNSSRFDGVHVQLVGGTPETLKLLEQQFDRVRWTQFLPAPNVMHDHNAQQAIVEAVIAARADIVFMAYGSLQSELVCGRLHWSGAARGVALCVGASLEFVTGEKRRAPRALQRLHLEWLFRLISEPRRLWRRYLVVGPRIFLIWLRYLASPRAAPSRPER